MNALWICPNCDSKAHWKGLCRKCTVYDKEGKPTNPIPRMRQPSQTNNLPYHYIPPTKESFLAQRRRQPTKKQIRAMKEAQKKHHAEHECGDECTHDHKEYDFVEIGGEEE